MRFTIYISIIMAFFLSKKGHTQSFYGFTVDEKLFIHKNRIGLSVFRQGKKNGKTGISLNYNYATYVYAEGSVHLNNSGTGYISERTDTPPYWKDLALNTKSTVNGFDVEIFNNLRLKTFKNSNMDLKISAGYGLFNDRYTTEFFGEKRTGNFHFSSVMCNMYFTYLVWYKKIGFEPLIGIAYYYPLLRKNYYLSPNPFVAAELEAGISIYYQKKKNHQR